MLACFPTTPFPEIVLPPKCCAKFWRRLQQAQERSTAGSALCQMKGFERTRFPRSTFQSLLRTAGTIAISIPSKFCFRFSGNRKMHFSAPAKCTLQAPKQTHCSQNKCVYRGSQNALRHLARENALRRQWLQNEQILRMRVVGPRLPKQCRLL